MRNIAEHNDTNAQELNNNEDTGNQEEQSVGLPTVEGTDFRRSLVYSDFEDIIGEISGSDLLFSLRRCIKIEESINMVARQFKKCPQRYLACFHKHRIYLKKYYPDLLFFLERNFEGREKGIKSLDVTDEVVCGSVEAKLKDLKYLSGIVQDKIKSINKQIYLTDIVEAHTPAGSGKKKTAPLRVNGKKGEGGEFVNTLTPYKIALFIKIIDYIKKYECTEAHACRQVCKMKKYLNEDPNLTRKLFNSHKNNHNGTLDGLREFLNSVAK